MNKSITQKISELERNISALLNSQDVTHGLKRSMRALSKEVFLYKNHIAGPKKLPTIKPLKVQVGGGVHILEGFYNIDIVPPADLVWDIRESIPLQTGSVKYIFSEHFLEHIDYPISVKKFIKESHRILSKGGEIVIGVPDSELAVKAYYEKDLKQIRAMIKRWYSKRNNLEHFNTPIDFLNYHFRDQDDDKKYNPHIWGYDFEKLKSLLELAGFTKISRWKFDPKIANPKREFGSVYVYGIK